jgi:methylase of polypeptide subunit release factors
MRGQDHLQRQGVGMTSQRTRERLIERLYEEGLSNPRVLEVIRRTPRHLFVDEALAHRAYEDTALPIGHNQTISQPYIVGRMTELLLAGGPLDKVLEIGTGSGYQTAVLAQLVERVFSSNSSCATWCSAGATAGRAGTPWGRTTASWSLRPPRKCRRRCWISWPSAGAWSSRSVPGRPRSWC